MIVSIDIYMFKYIMLKYITSYNNCTAFFLIIMPPPCVTGEVYCFPRRQLIFSFDRRVIYHLKSL